MAFTFKRITGLGLLLALAACAQQEPPRVVYAQPTFDKFGAPSCRPGDVPIGGIYTADLPECEVLSAPSATAMATGNGMSGDGMSGDGMSEGSDPTDPSDGGGAGNQNRNQNTENERNRSNMRGG